MCIEMCVIGYQPYWVNDLRQVIRCRFTLLQKKNTHMNVDDQAHYDSGKRVQIFGKSEAYNTALNTIPDYPGWEVKLNAVLLEIEVAAKTQQKDNSGIAGDKTDSGSIMIASLMKYSLRAKTEAKGMKNKLLLDGLSHPDTYYRGSADIIVSRANAVKDLMKNNLTLLTVLKATEITEMEANILTFNNSKDLPTSFAKEKKSTGTDLMEPLKLKLDDAIESIGDLVHSYFPETVMASNFDLTSKLIRHGRHNILEVHFLDDAGKPISGGVLYDENSDKMANADDNVATIVSVKTGKGSFKAEAPGFVAQVFPVRIKRSTTTTVFVKLKRIS